MKKPDDEQEKQELLRILAETKQIAPKLIEKGRNLTEAGQSALDWATTLERIAISDPSGFFGRPIIAGVSSGFREFNSLAQVQYRNITADENLMQIVHANATSTAVSSLASSVVFPSSTGGIIPELKSLEMLLHRSVDVDKTKELLRTLHLDAPQGATLSPLQLLQSAEEALKRPFADEGYAQAVLVPTREAIQGTIEQLLKWRRCADKASRWVDKVTSIADQCGTAGLSSEHINRVATTTHTLINELSAAKDRIMSRERITSLFDQSISLIQDIVSLIDKDKLRAT